MPLLPPVTTATLPRWFGISLLVHWVCAMIVLLMILYFALYERNEDSIEHSFKTDQKRSAHDGLPAGGSDLHQQLIIERVLVGGVVVRNSCRNAKRELVDHIEREILDRPVGRIGGEQLCNKGEI